jgi:hypothetical protein
MACVAACAASRVAGATMVGTNASRTSGAMEACRITAGWVREVKNAQVSARERHTGKVRQLAEYGILLRHDQGQRIDLLLQDGILLSEIVQSVTELNDLLAYRDVGSARGATRAHKHERNGTKGSKHRRSRRA